MGDSIACDRQVAWARNEYIELLKKVLTGSPYEQSSWSYLRVSNSGEKFFPIFSPPGPRLNPAKRGNAGETWTNISAI